jgi:hypothetical protein
MESISIANPFKRINSENATADAPIQSDRENKDQSDSRICIPRRDKVD